MRGWVAPGASSAAWSDGMECRWKGPAANAMCWTEVGMDCENKKMVLLELFGCATCIQLERNSTKTRKAYLFHKFSTAYNDGRRKVTLFVIVFSRPALF
jgi:hypothetical protein